MVLKIDQRIHRCLRPEDQRLLQQTLEELVREDLVDVAQALCERAMRPSCELARVLDPPDTLTDTMQLLLIELRSIATAPGWTGRLRRTRAYMALDMCGFQEEHP